MLLKANTEVPIMEYRDDKGFTLLHKICFKNLEKLGLEVIALA